MRSAGCIVNDLIDMPYDGLVKRTAGRPLVQKTVSPKEAYILSFILLVMAFLLVTQLGYLVILLSIPALILAILYPFMKRFTYLPQAFLGFAFSCGIPMAYAAESACIPYQAIVLCLANLAWVIAYDTQYAMVDKEDDLKIGVKSTAILFGVYAKIIVFLLQVVALALFVFLGLAYKLSPIYFIGLSIAFMLAMYQQYLLHKNETNHYFKAFLNNHYFGMVIFLGLYFSIT